MIAEFLRAAPGRLKTAFLGSQALSHRYAAFFATLNSCAPDLAFGSNGDVPWIAVGVEKLTAYGFASDSRDLKLYETLARWLPPGIPATHFRLVRDFITRWVYPHMRPDLSPTDFAVDQRHGFHGQHKDAIADYRDSSARARLLDAFRPGPDDVVIDCGAFIGLGAIRMTRDAPRGRVIAVEASRACFDLLQRNIRGNGASRVEALHNAVWNRETQLNLETTVAQANSLVVQVVAGKGREPVETVTIDGLVARFELKRLDMLSLTLNGAEIEALEGAQETLRTLRPRVRAAGWYMRSDRRIADLLVPLLADAGYDVFVGPRGNVMALPVRTAVKR